jgi:hypothetical protein
MEIRRSGCATIDRWIGRWFEQWRLMSDVTDRSLYQYRPLVWRLRVLSPTCEPAMGNNKSFRVTLHSGLFRKRFFVFSQRKTDNKLGFSKTTWVAVNSGDKSESDLIMPKGEFKKRRTLLNTKQRRREDRESHKSATR